MFFERLFFIVDIHALVNVFLSVLAASFYLLFCFIFCFFVLFCQFFIGINFVVVSFQNKDNFHRLSVCFSLFCMYVWAACLSFTGFLAWFFLLFFHNVNISVFICFIYFKYYLQTKVKKILLLIKRNYYYY